MQQFSLGRTSHLRDIDSFTTLGEKYLFMDNCVAMPHKLKASLVPLELCGKLNRDRLGGD